MPGCPARRRWFQSCIVRPMTLRPSARSMAATAEESTPPDIATAMVGSALSTWQLAFSFDECRSAKCQLLTANGGFGPHRRKFSQTGYRLRNQVQCEVYILGSILLAQAQANA